MTKTMPLKLIAPAAVLILCGTALAAQFSGAQALPESAGVRRNLTDWFTLPLEELRGRPPEERRTDRGEVFQVRLEERGGVFDVIVAPREVVKLDVYSDDGIFSEMDAVFTADNPGGWILTRDSATGRPLSVVIHFAGDRQVFARFTPGKKGCDGELVIFGARAARGVETGVPFERLYTASFQDIQKWTPTIPWQYAGASPSLYEGCAQMIGVIRSNARRFVPAKDACYDETGEPISILTGEKRPRSEGELQGNKLFFSDAGFLKWIVDGLVAPITQGYTMLAPLTRPTVAYKPGGYQGGIAERYNISFSLDWTRNLASAAAAAKTGRSQRGFIPGVDVVYEPFALADETTHIKDAGYPAGGLYPLLYVLAVMRPDEFYLAAVRESDNSVPPVRFFSRCAVIFPYFDASGRFQGVVFENGEEMSLEDFIGRCKNDTIHLTKVEASTRFFPQ